MSRPSSSELAQLNRLSNELREEFEERGHRIDKGLSADRAFGRGSRSSMTRELVADVISAAASPMGIDFRSVNGAGRELRFLSAVDRRYRLRRARRSVDGELVVPVSSDSALAIDELTLIREEHWGFLWVVNDDSQMAEVLIAEIVGFTEGRPGRLRFGEVIALGSPNSPRGGFRPTDEDLDLGDEDGFGRQAS